MTQQNNDDLHGEDGIEQIVLPDLPVIDSHIHLWNRTGFDYFAPEFLADASAGHAIEASIYVECDMAFSNDPRPEFRPVGETEYVQTQVEQAAGSRHRLAAGILGCADLRLGTDIAPVLEAHIEAGKGRFKGLRSRIAWDADPIAGYGEIGYYPHGNVVNDDGFLAGAGVVQKLGLVLELWAFHPQLENIRTFAGKMPNLPIVLNHVGGPLGVGRYAGHRDEVFRDWSAGIRRLAEMPNVHVKLSGLGITRMGYTFPGGQAKASNQLVAVWLPYIDVSVQAFGPQRCIFGSNFPVDRQVSSYPILLNAYKKMLFGLSADELGAVFAGNARKLYTF